jgi:hypothetical protein
MELQKWATSPGLKSHCLYRQALQQTFAWAPALPGKAECFVHPPNCMSPTCCISDSHTPLSNWGRWKNGADAMIFCKNLMQNRLSDLHRFRLNSHLWEVSMGAMWWSVHVYVYATWFNGYLLSTRKNTYAHLQLRLLGRCWRAIVGPRGREP